tara:strand:- start:331 stop:999 length:669 start_codon:yes stop_codon:yes gene_type:complete
MEAFFDKSRMYEYETGFSLTANSERYGKFLTHYELYKKIIDIPGELVECGVYRGTSITRFAMFRNMFETNFSRKIIGFDNFDNIYPDTKWEEDREARESWIRNTGADSITVDQLKKVFKSFDYTNYDFVKGNLVETLPKYISENPHIRIALLNIDIDFVEPTYAALECLYDRVVSGGVILIDNYAAFHGDTKGIDMFFENRGIKVCLKKLPFNARPSFLIKE